MLKRRQGAGLPPLLALNLHGVSLAEGVRAGLAVAAVVALGQWDRWPGLMEAALGALLTCFADPGGPVRRRLPSMIAFAALGTAMMTLFGLLAGASSWIVVPVASATVFLTCFARSFGRPAMLVGNLLTVVLVLALREPLGPATAVALGGMFLAGSIWALLLTLVIWRLHPYQPARRAVGEAYRALAGLAADLRALLAQGAAGQASWDQHARLHRRQVRDAIEAAREAVLQTVRARGPIHGQTAHSWVRLEAADQMFSALIGLSDLLADTDDPALRARAQRMLRLLGPVLLLLQRAVVADRQASRPALDRAIAAIRMSGGAEPGDRLAGVAEALADRLRLAATPTVLAAAVPRPGRGTEWGDVLRANLRWRSDSLRHALRGAVLAACAFAATRQWPGPYAYWFTITLVLTMQPYFALTFTRAVERIGGTVLGGLFAAGLASVATTPAAIAEALFPLAMLALAVRAVSFGVYMAALTPMIVLLSELGHPGRSEIAIALARAGYTLAGGALALVGAWLLWPSWEPERVRAQARKAVAAHARYAATEVAALLGEAAPPAVEAARRAAGVASNTLESSLQRALLEPRRGRDAARLEAALTIDAALRRVAGRLSALHLSARPAAVHDEAAWRAWAAFFLATAERAATSPLLLPPRPRLPGDPDAEALARMTAQFELIAGASVRVSRA